MLLNFCDPILKPRVECDRVSTDDYEVTNLVSGNDYERQKGFMTYFAIKPPVTVTFHFLCDVNLHHIAIWPQVGQQKSERFEIHAKSAQSKISEFHRIGYGCLKENDKGIVFSRYGISSTSLPHGFAHEYLHKPKVSNFKLALSNVNSIQVKIVFARSVPALQKVEIWGTPSFSCSVNVRETVHSLWKSYNAQIEEKADFEVEPAVEVSSKNSKKVDSGFSFPEEFLDAITCEVMVLPMMLPCGKVVDQSTLEKHKECEAQWGRGPGDPFTGLLFTSSRYPVPATALKSRLDMFLLMHSARKEVNDLPRTVGRKHRSCYISPGLSAESIGAPYSLEETCSYAATSQFNGNFCKRKHDAETTEQDLEDAETSSLNAALKLALQGRPSFLNKRQKQSNDHCCVECKATDLLFRLPCVHLLCRNCLLPESRKCEPKCHQCKQSFKAGDPLRVYT